MSGRLPLHILTGFLGSGKTTLLNRMLRSTALADSAILINEVGAIAIDHHLVQQVERADTLDITVLKGGCTCCTLRGDLVDALRALHARRAQGALPSFRRVILETTGLADPAPLLFTLASDPVLRHRFDHGTVVATVDAVHGAGQFERYPESRKQVAVADRLVVTKSDRTDADQVARLTAAVARLNPAVEVIDIHALDAPAFLFGPRALLKGDTAGAHHVSSHTVRAPRADHTDNIATVAFTLDAPIEWSPFSVWLSLLVHAHGEKLLRFKALLNVAGWSSPVALDGIHHLIHAPIHLPAWPEGPRTSRIVMIVQGISPERIEGSLRTFLLHAARCEPTVAATASPS